MELAQDAPGASMPGGEITFVAGELVERTLQAS
jgi:hypothetical protein